jgi:hypothetical protein
MPVGLVESEEQPMLKSMKNFAGVLHRGQARLACSRFRAPLRGWGPWLAPNGGACILSMAPDIGFNKSSPKKSVVCCCDSSTDSLSTRWRRRRNASLASSGNFGCCSRLPLRRPSVDDALAADGAFVGVPFSGLGKRDQELRPGPEKVKS